MTDRCFVEGCQNPAPYGLRQEGRYQDIPAEKRGKYLPYCREHERDAFERRAKALGLGDIPRTLAEKSAPSA